MQSFQNVLNTSKQNLSHIIQKLDHATCMDLAKKADPLSITAPHWMHWLLFHRPDFYSIEELLHHYSELEKPDTFIIASQQLCLSSSEEKTKLQYALELGKLAIKIAVLNNLSSIINKEPQPQLNPPNQLKKLFKKLVYWILLPIGIVIATFQGIDGISSLCELLGVTISLSAWPVVILSIMSTLFACALYYAFELEFLKEKLGLGTHENLQNIMVLYEKQIDTTTKIETHLLMASEKLDDTEKFKTYIMLCQKFKAQITQINKSMFYYPESTIRKMVRYCIMKAGVILAIGDTLYTVTGVLGGTVLVNNPLSLIFFTLLAVGAAVFFIVSYSDNVYEKINGATKQMNDTKEKAAYYCDHHLLDQLQEKLAAKQRLKKSRENNLVLQRKLMTQAQQLKKQQLRANQQQKEIELWKMWRSAKHSASPPPVTVSHHVLFSKPFHSTNHTLKNPHAPVFKSNGTTLSKAQSRFSGRVSS